MLNQNEGHVGSESADSTNFAWTKLVNVTFDPASVPAQTSPDQDVTVPGAKVGDVVVCNPPVLVTNLGVGQCRVKQADTVTVRFINPTAGALDAASGTWQFWLLRKASGA